MSKIDKNEHDKIIKIKFENFFKILTPSLKNFVNL